MTEIRTVEQMWPEHAGHDVRYSEHGRTDYRLTQVVLEHLQGEPPAYVINAHAWDTGPIDGRITETELWCADCGIQFTDYESEEWEEPIRDAEAEAEADYRYITEGL